MCRILSYLGSPVLLENLLYAPDSSLLNQTIGAQMLHMLNLAGFGMAAWDEASHDPQAPFRYRTTQVALFDRNLKALAAKLQPSALLAHIRGVPYNSAVQVNDQNCHPFRFEGLPLSMAHNGDLAGFRDMRFDLAAYIRPEFARQIQGSTDSEWIYALVVSALADPAVINEPDAILAAIRRALSILREVRERHGITRSSSANLMFCDGVNLVAVRFTFDFGRFDAGQLQGTTDYLSMWYTFGRDYGLHDGEWKLTGGAAGADSVIVASEPLTRDFATWIEVPEYSALLVRREGLRRRAEIHALEV
ncbi:class II glutamine amidotransferase [Novosphingobium sp. MMS21-SN21R]|uniref:class II glutamine amidotransferase n=1 Tax=Novosphingobium sp. MMS21-SN21R TaxID=2969298 RepID=UPI0028836710|nr:class II glutamine amidotransferase [Novosphingobium sp. MMS21-SN21R]MDT0509137.1 class II glutamine amidotransferase [Novosphingobium sp. MMS21-SN21R]